MRSVYLNRILFVGICLLGIGIYELAVTPFFLSSTVPIKGVLRNANIYYSAVTDRRDHRSQKSEFIFYLKNLDQKYYICENIGSDFVNEKYQKLLMSLKHADSLTVWVKKSEKSAYTPSIYQLAADNDVIYSFEEISNKRKPVMMICVILGIASVIIYLYNRFPEKVRQFFS